MNTLQKYFKYRQSLIDQYIKGDMTKSEYLAENLDAVLSLNIKPFKNIDTVDKGLFNYQYYNALAKDAKMTGAALGNKELEKIYIEKTNYYYSKKDKATLRVLELSNYKNIEAYFIQVKSKYLKGLLFEIVLKDYNMILHSTSSLILKRLREEYIFENTIKKSLIDGYINQRY